MQDLNVIQANNVKACHDAIAKSRADGKYVVAIFSGLHYVSHTTHDTSAEAAEAESSVLKGNTEHTKFLAPTYTPETATA